MKAKWLCIQFQIYLILIFNVCGLCIVIHLLHGQMWHLLFMGTVLHFLQSWLASFTINSTQVSPSLKSISYIYMLERNSWDWVWHILSQALPEFCLRAQTKYPNVKWVTVSPIKGLKSCSFILPIQPRNCDGFCWVLYCESSRDWHWQWNWKFPFLAAILAWHTVIYYNINLNNKDLTTP